MGLDKIKSLFAKDDAAAATSVSGSGAELDKKAIFKDVALNDFTPTPLVHTPSQSFSIPSTLRPSAAKSTPVIDTQPQAYSKAPFAEPPEDAVQEQIEAAQFQPFAVNYQSRSPNYDALAQEQQARDASAEIASFNDKETVPFKLSCLLFFRQLIAAFFSHTTLSIMLPRLSLRFGPSYPGSMALPYLAVGVISGALAALLCYYTDNRQLTGGFCLFFYIICTGLTSFRGMAELLGLLTRRRPDSITYGAALMLPSVLFIFMLNVTFVRNEPFEGGILFAIAAMLSAAFASSLAIDLKQDPVDSFGTMSLKGLLTLTAVSVCVCLFCLKLSVASSIFGLALLLRLILGYYYNRHNVLASRQTICAAQLIIMLALIFDLLLFSLTSNILNDNIYVMLSAHHLLAALS